MNILDKCNLEDKEADLLCTVINLFGEGSHPPADEASIYFFTPDYAIECLNNAKESCLTNPKVTEPVKAISALIVKLEAHQAAWGKLKA